LPVRIAAELARLLKREKLASAADLVSTLKLQIPESG
jgi:hypothetical protein